MNAIVHRDYTLNSNVQIMLKSGSIEIMSPGNLPFELEVADLSRNHLSLPRNPDISHVCFLAGLIEKVGRGTEVIVKSCMEAGLPRPRWVTTHMSTTLTLFSDIDISKSSRREFQALPLTPKLSEILEVLKGANIREISVTDFSMRYMPNSDVRTVRYHMDKLVSQGYLIKNGTPRNFTYSLVDQEL
jgi:predicted HTH transcriptional regulator